jgi:hypothetical protein
MPEEKVETPVDKVERTSRIKFGISRTLNTAKYENVVILHEVEEDITWKTVDERQSKLKNWETVFVKEYKDSHDRILQELGLTHKKAYFVRAEEKIDNRLELGEKYGENDDHKRENIVIDYSSPNTAKHLHA